MNKHTPGPWTTSKSAVGMVLAGTDYLADCNYSQVPEDVMVANTRLMASAPDLLAALENLYEVGCKERQASSGDLQFAREAINKARGTEKVADERVTW